MPPILTLLDPPPLRPGASAAEHLAVAQAWEAAAPRITSWRRLLGYAAERARAEGVAESTFAAAAAIAHEFAAEPPTPPEEPATLAGQTPSQQRIWRYVRERWLRHHLDLAARDVGRALGLTSGCDVYGDLAELVRADLLERTSARPPHFYRPTAKWR